MNTIRMSGERPTTPRPTVPPPCSPRPPEWAKYLKPDEQWVLKEVAR